MRNIILIIALLTTPFFYAQELNCKVTLNAKNIGGTNTQVFNTLEKALNDYVNNTTWTNRTVANNERINCSVIITVNNYANNHFKANIQIQSSRPVYNSSYESSIFNYKDGSFEFDYVEFDPLEFDKTAFTSNLIDTMAFYAYVIIGLDSDTFANNGGAEVFKNAYDIVNKAQSELPKSGEWSLDNAQSRYHLIDELTSDTYEVFHSVMYGYHRLGLDTMASNAKAGKEMLKINLMELKKLYDIRSNALLLKLFFDTKTDEIVDVFSSGPKVPNKDLKLLMIKLSPYNSVRFQRMKY